MIATYEDYQSMEKSLAFAEMALEIGSVSEILPVTLLLLKA